LTPAVFPPAFLQAGGPVPGSYRACGWHDTGEHLSVYSGRFENSAMVVDSGYLQSYVSGQIIPELLQK